MIQFGNHTSLINNFVYNYILSEASLPPSEAGPSYPRRPPMQSRIPRPPALPRPQSGSKLALPPDYCIRLDRPPSASKIPLPPGLSRAAVPSRIPQPPADAIEHRRTPQIARPRSISKVPLASGLSRQGTVARPPAGVRPPPACPVPSVRRPPPVARPSVVQRPAPVRRVSRGRLMPPPQLKVSAPRQAKPKGPQRPGLARQKKAILEKQLQRGKQFFCHVNRILEAFDMWDESLLLDPHEVQVSSRCA